ncbi:DNA-binding response regulator [Lacihabitans sp. CCS-44]|uniref:LytR/AlgR family response regulator transcription factor n=1 Tax=Lacihabitans sp. CCS-44 TaxID=2487331 RepID=UPI0020CE95FA|nr:LytTR family DNA-binding domain-containing protein [Lacihabitans sp. CCS-44]MCP9754843.1 DNA-binding response regulator [Lacihabitans sp. CCS-44]
MKIKCILVDDEPFALDILEDDLLSFEQIEILAKFSGGEEAIEYLQNHEVDLMFSDIQMPGLLGTQMVRSLENPPLVIFTTAFHQFAVEGFELNAVDYLMKPIRKERLAEALKKVENLLGLKQKAQTEPSNNYIILNVEYKKVKLLFDEILYVEGLKDYVKIYLENRVHPLLTRSNLKGMENKLPEEFFLRIHNSFMVNKSKITGFNQSKLDVGKTELPIGKTYVDKIMEVLS